MHRRHFGPALLATAACTASARDTLFDHFGTGIDDAPHVGEPAAARDFATASNTLGFELWAAMHRGGNLAIAPAIVSLLLGMTWLGARGDTAAQMAKVLHLDDATAAVVAMGEQLSQWNAPVHGAYRLAVLEHVFDERTERVEPGFLAAVEGRFAAPLESADVRRGGEAVRARLDDGVVHETEDRIVDRLPTGTPDRETRLVHVSVVYFGARWQRTFEPDATHERAFYVDGRTPEITNMMRQVSQLAYASTDGAQVVELPYRGDHLAMTLVVPRQRDGLDALERGLDATSFAAWVAALRPTQVELTLPRFELEMSGSSSLGPALVELGMPLAFGVGADFTGVSQSHRPLFVDDVLHRTFVAVDEQGTAAAAAKAAVTVTASAAFEPDGVEVLADHPFLFVLRDTRSGAILFIGRVVDPTA